MCLPRSTWASVHCSHLPGNLRRACFHRGFPDRLSWTGAFLDWGFPMMPAPAGLCSAAICSTIARAGRRPTRIGLLDWTFDKNPTWSFSASRWVLFGAVDRHDRCSGNAKRGGSPRNPSPRQRIFRGPSSSGQDRGLVPCPKNSVQAVV